MGSISFLTYNVNGLREDIKRREVFHYLHTKGHEIVFLQETHSTLKDEKYWSMMWGSKIWFDHGESNACGVAILIPKNSPIKIHNVIKSEMGRYIILYVIYKESKLVLANIYGPNQGDLQFFKNVFEDNERSTPNYYIIGGDLNMGIDKIVD